MHVLESNRTRVTRSEMHGPMYTSYSDEALQAIIRFIWIGYINNILCYRDFTTTVRSDGVRQDLEFQVIDRSFTLLVRGKPSLMKT